MVIAYDSRRMSAEFAKETALVLCANGVKTYLFDALRPVALLLGATPELLPSCLTYGRILLTFQTAFMLQYLFQSFLLQPKSPSWACSSRWQRVRPIWCWTSSL